ncbi:MAG: peroxidase [Planctomycetia bacterium]|nr:peroxidase [Planctomycetia bacterium]
MRRRLTLSVEQLEARALMAADLATLFAAAAPAAYSVDGTGNNLNHPDWGSAGTQLLRIAPADYADGVAAPAGADRPSARQISNVIVDQGDNAPTSDRFLSAMVYAWGQFIDHDLDLTPNADPAEPFNVSVPAGDPYFDPAATGTRTIKLNRSAYDPATGTTDPREQVNVITAWLDGSVIYGSDDETAAALRTFEGGRLKTGPGDMLPYNSAEYLPDGPLDMQNAGPVPNGEMYAAGDVRANENIELTSLHVLFLREHNYWADRIAAARPKLDDEQVFQKARAIVIAEIQSITYNQWLPAVLGRGAVDRYTGYDATVNPGIANEFSTAGFRLGHSLLGDDVEFLDNLGREIAAELPLSEAFFNPAALAENGIDPVLKYLASDPSSELDNTIVGSVRNFLFGPPGAGGFDLASLNIQRGRDHGLADYNSVREAYGLPRVASFDEITSDAEVQAKLEQLYGSVDNIDLWVGALAEDHVRGASVGPLLRTIVSDQFERVRDGDRLWYERTFSGRTLERIENTTLTDIMRRNTELTNLQENAFFFKATIGGTVFDDADGDSRLDRRENPLAGTTVQLVDSESGEIVAVKTTNDRGRYEFGVLDGLRPGDYQIRVALGDGAIHTSRIVAITRGGQLVDGVNVGVVGDDGNRPDCRDRRSARHTQLDTAVRSASSSTGAEAQVGSTAWLAALTSSSAKTGTIHKQTAGTSPSLTHSLAALDSVFRGL